MWIRSGLGFGFVLVLALFEKGTEVVIPKPRIQQNRGLPKWELNLHGD